MLEREILGREIYWGKISYKEESMSYREKFQSEEDSYKRKIIERVREREYVKARE